jgi:hypothetical protein
MSISRQIRRAAERRAVKVARKAERQAALIPTMSEDAPLGTARADVFMPSDIADSRPVVMGVPPEHSELRIGPTGPRTPEGKAIASLNNLKHGLTGAFRVLEFESQSDFDAAHDALIAEHQPTTPTESQIVRRMAEHA